MNVRDSDMPSAFRTIWRTARRQHTCCECRRAIAKGERYEYASGVWDGSPAQFHTCARCAHIRNAHIAAEGAASGEPCCATFGELFSEIREVYRAGEDEYLGKFREVYRKRGAA